GPGLVVGLRHARQFLQEGDDLPDFLVRHFDFAEARHAGHVDAVLDHPEQLVRPAIVDDLLEVGRVGTEPLGELRPLDARRAMAIPATARLERLRTGLNVRRVVDWNRRRVDGVMVDRSGTDLDQRPLDGGGILLGRRNAVKAAEEISRGGNGDHDGEGTYEREEFHPAFSRFSVSVPRAPRSYPMAARPQEALAKV